MTEGVRVQRRAIYPYRCARCGKRRMTRKYHRAIDQVCRVCKGTSIPDNQRPLFPIITPHETTSNHHDSD